ncbi:MAG: peptide deformylase [bacterium]|nr:peptide deformylase [bacterium]MDZ4248009.1 peptide deformylase [Patescibacteria group bacterium]
MEGKRLPLVPSDHPVLHKTASKVPKPAEVRGLVADMLVTMKTEGGVGLAAPQVGRSVRLFVTGIGDQRVFINPELEQASDELIWWEEGCLSLPRLLGDVQRPGQVTVAATGLDGKRFTLTADQLYGRVIQHEIDHLDGILFPDRMTDVTKIRELTEEEWQSRFQNKRLHDEEM